MANENKNVGSVAESKVTSLELKVTVERGYYNFADQASGKRVEGIKPRFVFDLDGETFKVSAAKRDSRLLLYMLRKMGLPIIDTNGEVLPESIIAEIEERRRLSQLAEEQED